MKKVSPAFLRQAIALSILFVPSLAHAHTGAGATHGFVHGFGHPLTGLDHLCAMLAVGLWAAQMGGRAIWAVPLTFVSVMALGGVLGMMGIQMPFVEQGIVLSVLLLGVLIAAAVRLPLAASVVIVGLFAIFHGHAHSAEMPENAAGYIYAAGFVIATALLHACGIGLGIAMQRFSAPQVIRFAGVVLAICGAWLWLS